MSRRTDDADASAYEIRVGAHLDRRWAARFDGLALRQEAGGTTVISGRIADQAALHGLLQRVRDLGLPLVSVSRLEPDRPTALDMDAGIARTQEGDPTR